MKGSSIRRGLWPLVAAVAAAPGVSAEVLEEVVVTAQKREESVQDVGIAITAFSGEQMEQLGFTNSTQISEMSPGVYVSGSSAGQNSQYTVRGVTQNDFLDAIEGPTAIYIDEGYVAQQNGGTFGMFDIDRVEILKGPQGTLFGRNATGGLVHFVTRKPTKEAEGYADLTYGSYNQLNVTGAVSGPVTDAVQMRASVFYNRHDDILKNIYPFGQFPAGSGALGGGEDHWNDDTLAGRVQLNWDINEDASFYFMGHGYRINTGDGPYQQSASRQVFNAAGQQIDTIPIPGGADFFGYTDPDGEDFITSKDFAYDDNADFSNHGMLGKFEYDLGWANLHAISDYKKFDRNLTVDVDSGPVDQLTFNSLTDTWSFTQEVRLDGELDRWRWVAGMYYLHIDANVINGFLIQPGSVLAAAGLGGTSAPNQVELLTDSYSGFGQVEYDLTDQLTFIAGLRIIQEEKDYSLASSLQALTDNKRHEIGTPLALFPSSAEDLSGAPYTEETSDTLWAGKVGLNYQYTDDLLLYFSVNRGVKAGAFNAPLPLTGAPLPGNAIGYDEEILLSYEGGFKSTLFDGIARLNVSAYYYDYTDYQASSFVGVSNIVTNQPANSYGVEADIQTNPIEGLDFMFGVSAFDFTVEDITLAAATATAPAIIKDVEPAFAPKLQMAGLVRYEWPFLSGALAAQMDANYRSKFFHNLNNFSASKYPSAVMGNARLTYLAPDDKWQASFFINNLADARNKTIGFDLAGLCGCNEDAYVKPRWFGVNLKYNFF